MGSSALVSQLVKENENSEFKPVKSRLKIDLVSYPARAEGLINRIILSNNNSTSKKFKQISVVSRKFNEIV